MNGQEEKLQQEILAEAKRRADRAVTRAERDVRNALETTQKELDAERSVDLQLADTQANEKVLAITARIEHEIQRRWLTAREECLDAIFSQTGPTVAAGDTIRREESYRQLLEEALSAIGPMNVILRVHPDNADMCTQVMVDEVKLNALGDEATATTVRVLTDPSVSPGLIVETEDARVRFDNTYRTRLERLKPALRSLLVQGMADTEI